MQCTIITLFPEYFTPLVTTSVVGRAHKNQIIQTQVINLRDFGLGEYQKVDDAPYGGGAGMVLMIEPIDKALQSVGAQKGQRNSKILLTSAKGALYTQSTAREFSKLDHLVIICGHYEGVDERVAEYLIDEEVRIGDYVLSGGEPAASVIIDSVARLLPGVLGNEESLVNESHELPGKLAAPQYTRPEIYNELSVPKILLSGDHKKIANWKQEMGNGNREL